MTSTLMDASAILKLPHLLAWSVLIVVVGGWAWWRLGSAQSAAEQALQQRDAITRDVGRVADLRQRTVVVGTGVRSDADLVTRAQRALSMVGLPVRACKGVQPRSAPTGSAGGIRYQQVELMLQGLTPGEFGAWLGAWTTPDQPWHIREVVFNHQVEQSLTGQPSSSLDSNRFQITVLLTAPIAEDAP